VQIFEIVEQHFFSVQLADCSWQEYLI